VTYHPRGYIGPGYQGTLGYGFATALGAKAADPARAVIAVTGDGGFSWTMPELSTAKRYGLGLVTVLFNDGYYGNVRRIQKNRYGARYFASDLTNPDYQTLAGSFGIGFARAWTPAELAAVLTEAVAANKPILIEVPVGEFPSPWHLIHEGLPTPPTITPGAHLRTERESA
jgi:acetolactate synthase I/II/III large subunit